MVSINGSEIMYARGSEFADLDNSEQRAIEMH